MFAMYICTMHNTIFIQIYALAFCTHCLHMYKISRCIYYCSGQGEAVNWREFPLTALYGAAGDGYVRGIVEVCALFAPSKDLRF